MVLGLSNLIGLSDWVHPIPLLLRSYRTYSEGGEAMGIRLPHNDPGMEYPAGTKAIYHWGREHLKVVKTNYSVCPWQEVGSKNESWWGNCGELEILEDEDESVLIW